MKSRTRARCVALQALYEIDLTGHPVQIVIQERIMDETLDEKSSEFVHQIVQGVWPIVKE
jgi:N utilization substance protein B